MLGHINKEDGAECHAVLDPSYLASPPYHRLVAHALLPINGLWIQRPAARPPLAPRRGSLPRFEDYYAIPLVKQALRSILYFLYVLLFAYVTHVAPARGRLEHRERPRRAPRHAGRQCDSAPAPPGHPPRRALKKAKGGFGEPVLDAETEAIFEAAHLPLGTMTTPEVLLVWWTVSLLLDEWNQYASAPETFTINFWNK